MKLNVTDGEEYLNLRSLNPTKQGIRTDLRVPSTIALEEVKAGMARVETSLKEEVEGLNQLRRS